LPDEVTSSSRACDTRRALATPLCGKDIGVMATVYPILSFQRRQAVYPQHRVRCAANTRILLANSNQWYFNNLVKKPCHKTHCRCPHRLNLSFQPSRSCALPNIKVLKDKDLEFANSIHPVVALRPSAQLAPANPQALHIPRWTNRLSRG